MPNPEANPLAGLTTEELLRKALYSAVMIAIARNNIELEPDTMTEEEAAEDAAGACFGEATCSEEPLPELAEIRRRLQLAEGSVEHIRNLRSEVNRLVEVVDKQDTHIAEQAAEIGTLTVQCSDLEQTAQQILKDVAEQATEFRALLDRESTRAENAESRLRQVAELAAAEIKRLESCTCERCRDELKAWREIRRIAEERG